MMENYSLLFNILESRGIFWHSRLFPTQRAATVLLGFLLAGLLFYIPARTTWERTHIKIVKNEQEN